MDAILSLSCCFSYFSVMVGSIAIFKEAGATGELCVWSATDFGGLCKVETIKMPGPNDNQCSSFCLSSFL